MCSVTLMKASVRKEIGETPWGSPTSQPNPWVLGSVRVPVSNAQVGQQRQTTSVNLWPPNTRTQALPHTYAHIPTCTYTIHTHVHICMHTKYSEKLGLPRADLGRGAMRPVLGSTPRWWQTYCLLWFEMVTHSCINLETGTPDISEFSR